MRISDWSSDVCSSDLPAGEPGGEDQRLVQLLAELMGAEAARRAGPGRVQLADVEGRERGDVLKIGDVEDPEEGVQAARSEEHTSELQSLMRISYAVFCLKKTNNKETYQIQLHHTSINTSTRK